MFQSIIQFFYYLFYYLAGVVSVLIAIGYYYFFYNNIEKEEKPFHTKRVKDTELPDLLQQKLESNDGFNKETCIGLNFILQFFFQEKQHDKEIIIWLSEQLSMEFVDLLKHRALSKILKKMEIQDLNLGQNFPVIKSATTISVEMSKSSSLIDNIEMNVEIEYNGGFQLAIDAITKLSKKAFVKIKVVKLCGNGRLTFSRLPFTHWSFSFYDEPECVFKVETSVLGRTIPQFETIIENQLYQAVKKKHTLPSFKLRGAPLVRRKLSIPSPIECYSEIPSFPANLFATLIKCTRLQSSLVGSTIYFSLTLSEIPLICAYETPVGIWITKDILITRPAESSFGILLRTADDNCQVIETVNIKSVAYDAGLRKNDIVLAVNDVAPNSSIQTTKLLGPSSSDKGKAFLETKLRIKRLIFTDHGSSKKSSIDTKNLFEPINTSIDDSGISRIYSSSPSAQSTPVDDDISIDSSINLDAPSISVKSPVSFFGEKVVFASPLKSGVNSNGSTPESSRSGSPDLRKSLNVKGTDLSPIQSCDEDSSTNFLRRDTSGNSLENLSRSAPIEIPSTSNLSLDVVNQEKCSSNSAHSSRSGTPTFEFVPLMVPAGMPLVKMDIKQTSSKKSSVKNRIIYKHFETAPIEGCCDPQLGNDFEFQVDDENRYLNVCVWSQDFPLDNDKNGQVSSIGEKGGGGVSATKEVFSKLMKKESKESMSKDAGGRRLSKDVIGKISSRTMTGHPEHFLVGYANLSLKDVFEETSLNSQRNVIKVVNLEPADPSCPEVSDHPLKENTGFDPLLCYGDVMFSITHQPIKLHNKNLDKSSTGMAGSEDESATDLTQSDEEDFDTSTSQHDKEHNFMRTHFTNSTACEYCNRKIWLKDAFQCSNCGTICHKRCMSRCEQQTICNIGDLKYKDTKDNETESNKDIPDIFTIGPENASPKEKSISRKSPPHSPQPSLQGNPFLSEEENDKHLGKVLERLSQLTNLQDERLISMARESAQLLYNDIPLDLRLNKIKQELDLLHERVGQENETRKSLTAKEACTKNKSSAKSKLSKLIQECDIRAQALGLTTMHYFTAQQLTQDAIASCS